MSVAVSPEEEPLDPNAPYDAGDRRHVRAKEKKAKSADKERDNVMEAILSQPNGRAWLHWVMNTLCGVDAPTENGAYDSNALHWREGARAVGLALRSEAIRANRAGYLEMIKENLS